MKRQFFLFYIIIFSILFLQTVPVAFAQEQKSVPISATLVTTEILKSKIAETEASTSLEEQARTRLIELYRKAQSNLERKMSYQADAEAFAKARKTAPIETKELRKDMERKEKLLPGESLKISEKVPLSELEQQLMKEKANFVVLDAKLSELKNQLELQLERPDAARQRMIDTRRQQDTILIERKAMASSGESAALTQARNWVLETHIKKISTENQMLDQELLSHQSRSQLLEAKINDAEHSVAFIGKQVRLLEDLLSKRRLAEAVHAAQEAEAIKEEFKESHSLVRDLADNNLELGEVLKTRALELEDVSTLGEQASSDAKRIEDAISIIRKKLEVAGLNQVLGEVLLEQHRALPSLDIIQKTSSKRDKLIAASSLRQIQYGEDRRRLRNIEAYVSDLTKELSLEEGNAIHMELRKLAVKRKELLDKVMANEASYLRSLGELDFAQRRLIETVTVNGKFLEENLLWVRSTEPVSLSIFNNLTQEMVRLLSPSNWLNTGRDIQRKLNSSPLTVVMILVLVVLVFMRRRFLNTVVSVGENVGRIRTDRLWFTTQALFLTILASVPIPLLIMTIGWQIEQFNEAAEFSKAVAAGLMHIMPYYLFLLFFADLCVPGGLIEKHFQWSGATTSKLYKEFRLLMMFYLPTKFIAMYSYYFHKTELVSGMLLLTELAGLVIIGIFFFRFFTPRGGVLAEFLEKHPRSLLAGLRTVWLGLLIAINIAFILLVLSGYLYIGSELPRYLLNSFGIIFILLLGRGLALRWLLLVTRRLAYQAAVERREAARLAREALKKADENALASDEESLEIEEPEVDLATLDADSRKLLNTAILFSGILSLWVMWSPLLPAFGILNEITFWSYAAVVNDVETMVPVTLADLMLALIVAVVTTVATQGLPAFLEFILLQRTSITAGGRYTATTLLRYVIVGVGVTVFFSLLGGRWSQIQWLVAALSVGIGFGMQEIVANFISGLIILFERPIRVGDTVTVGGVNGVVSRINIRATTITNFDRQELLVPNKEFITSHLLNWSLTDPITRVRIPVGIAYGSDVVQAMVLMKEAAEEHENVLDDPAPSVTFENFGDNTLSLFLRAFLPSLENRVSTITDLHKAINHKFNEAGIVIAFPQRDIHLNTSEPLRISIEDA